MNPAPKICHTISEKTETTDNKKPTTAPAYLIYSLAVLWLWSGIQPIVFTPDLSLQLLAQTGVPHAWQWFVLIAASLWDIALGIACFSRLRAYPAFWLLQLLSVMAYSLIIAVRLPEFWAHPFAPLIKNLPIIALIFFIFQTTRRPT